MALKGEKMNKDSYYDEIIRAQQGKEYIEQMHYIKQEQCSDCAKRGKDTCRYSIKGKRCTNYVKKSNI